jgi:hypothetical protein
MATRTSVLEALRDLPAQDCDRCPAIVHAVVGLQRVAIIVLRWPGLRAHNGAATFRTLAEGTAAVRAVAEQPVEVSTVAMTYPFARVPKVVPVVGVHADDARAVERALDVLRAHGAREMALFDNVHQEHEVQR